MGREDKYSHKSSRKETTTNLLQDWILARFSPTLNFLKEFSEMTKSKEKRKQKIKEFFKFICGFIGIFYRFNSMTCEHRKNLTFFHASGDAINSIVAFETTGKSFFSVWAQTIDINNIRGTAAKKPLKFPPKSANNLAGNDRKLVYQSANSIFDKVCQWCTTKYGFIDKNPHGTTEQELRSEPRNKFPLNPPRRTLMNVENQYLWLQSGLFPTWKSFCIAGMFTRRKWCSDAKNQEAENW